MAIIQKIRNRAGLLVAVVIGAALVAFILGDFLSSGNVSFSSSANNIAEVNGKGVTVSMYEEYLSSIEEVNKLLRNTSSLDEQTTNAIREQVWQNIINDRVMGREYEKLGLNVHGDELAELILGDNPHAIIKQFFADPNTGAFSSYAVQNFWQNTNQVESDDTQKQIRLYIENIIDRERLVKKYNTLLNKGMYSTNLDAKRRKSDLNKTVDFSYIVKRYSEIPDSTVNVSDSELRAYYKKHKELYKQEKSRSIKYVEWKIVPTSKDRDAAKAWIKDAVVDLKGTDGTSTWQFIKSNSDISPNDKNYVAGELSPELDEFAFNSEVDDVYGPYYENDAYKIAKLVKIESLPDSVKASHILLKVDQNNYQAQQELADSLKKLIDKGEDFGKLAFDNSQDASKTDNGDLGWFGEGKMVRPFSDSCFYGKTGEIKMVYTQFGIHIIKINAQSRNAKKVKVAILAREVRPDDADDLYFKKANEFGGLHRTSDQFEKGVDEDKEINSKLAANIKAGDQNINGLENSRQLVRWAFTSEKGDVSNEVYQFGDKYVVAMLDKVNEDGYSAFEDVKSMIEIAVKKEKKGEQLIAQLSEATANAVNVNKLGVELKMPVKLATNIRFSSYSIPQLGAEPELIAASVNLEKGAVSDPIAGVNGVYVIQVDNITQSEMNDNYAMEKSFIERNYGAKINYNSSPVLNKLAKVEDNRITFF